MAGAVLLCMTTSRAAMAQGGGTVALPEVIVSATPVPTGESGGIDINKVPGDISVVGYK